VIGLILQENGCSRFSVLDSEEKKYICILPKKLKNKNLRSAKRLKIGMLIEFEIRYNTDTGTITRINLDKKNLNSLLSEEEIINFIRFEKEYLY